MACTSCHRHEAIFTRAYSGERFCEECFSKSIETKVRKTISKYNMFKPDDRIAVAVSGGKDSVALLQILHEIEGSFPYAEVIAVTVDEGIPGYRDEAAQIATEACKRLL